MESITYNSRIYEKILDTLHKMQESYYVNTVANDITKWTRPTEMQHAEGLRDISYDTLFDLTANIIKSIPEDLLIDPEVNAFIIYFTEVTSSITTYTISQEVLWNIDLSSKFLWIAFMLAIKTSHKLIPYFGKLLTDKEKQYILSHEDANGNNCFTFACWNIASLIELTKIFGWIHLTTETSNHVIPLDLLAYSGGLIQLLSLNIISPDDVLSYVNPYYNTNVMHFCAMSVDNTATLECLIASKKLTKSHMYLADKNNNFPLLIACIFGYGKNVEIMLQSQLYEQDILSLSNLGGHNVIYYAHANNLMKYFINFVDETNFFDFKLYTTITNDETFKLFVNSKLFTYNILTKQYNNGILQTTSSNNLITLFLNKLSYAEYLLNTNDEKIVPVMKQIFNNQKYLLAMSFTISHKLPISIIKSKYMNNDLLKVTHNGTTLIEKLMSRHGINVDSTVDSTDSIKELTMAIIDSPYTTADVITDDFVNFMAKNFTDAVHKLVERGFVESIITLTYNLLNTNNVNSIVTLFENNQDYVRELHQKGQFDLLKKLIQCHGKLFHILLANESTKPDIVSILTNNSVIDISNVLIGPNLSRDTWLLLIQSLSKDKLNSYNFIKNPESIVENIYEFSQLKILIDTRPDFDHSLFFKRPNGFFVSRCLCNDVETVKYLVNHTLLTQTIYDGLVPNLEAILIESHKKVAEQIIKHKYFTGKILNCKFANNNNLLQHLIQQKMGADLISYVVNHESMTQQAFNHYNNDSDNCLMVALYSESYVPIIINSKYFKPEMMQVKNKVNVSAEDIIYDHLDYDFLTMYFKLFPKSDLIYRRFKEGNTIAHKLVTDFGIHVLTELMPTLGLNILITSNDNGNTILHEITQFVQFYNKLDIILSSNIVPMWLKDLFYQQNKYGEMPLINIIVNTDATNISVFEKLITLKIFSLTDCNRIVTLTQTSSSSVIELIKMSIGEFITTKNLLVLNTLDKHNFDVPAILQQKDNNGEPLYFKLIRSNLQTTNKSYAKYIINEDTLMLTNANNDTLLFEIITTDQLVSTELLKIIQPNKINLSKLMLYPTTMKFLLSSFPKLFTKENLITCISQCVDINSETLELLLASDYSTNLDIFTELSGKPELLNVVLNSPICLNYMFENNLINQKMLQQNNYQLIFNIDNPVYLRSICDIVLHPNVNNDLVNDIRWNGLTIFHKCATYPNLVTYYLKKYLLICKDHSVLLAQDFYGKTFLDYLVENEYVDDLNYVVDTFDKSILYLLIENKDYQNKNIVMKCCTNKYQHILQKIKHHIKKVLFQHDRDNTSTLMYIVQYTNDLLPYVFQTIQFTDTYLTDHTNINGDDIFTIACRYNCKYLQFLLDNKYLVDRYKNFNKCFVIACRYEYRAITLLLDTGIKIKPKQCNGLLQYDDHICIGNFLQIACRYNDESVRELLNSKLNLQEYIDHIYIDKDKADKDIKFNALKLAMLYEPNAFGYILDSKYGSTKLINDTNELCKDNNCIIEMIGKQMASYVKLMKSKHIKTSMYNNHPKHGNILNTFSDMLSLSTATENLLKYKDIPCNETHTNVCSNCFSNENRVIFAPCSHKYCVMCSTRLHTCPQCRVNIVYKVVYQ